MLEVEFCPLRGVMVMTMSSTRYGGSKCYLFHACFLGSEVFYHSSIAGVLGLATFRSPGSSSIWMRCTYPSPWFEDKVLSPEAGFLVHAVRCGPRYDRKDDSTLRLDKYLHMARRYAFATPLPLESISMCKRGVVRITSSQPLACLSGNHCAQLTPKNHPATPHTCQSSKT